MLVNVAGFFVFTDDDDETVAAAAVADQSSRTMIDLRCSILVVEATDSDRCIAFQTEAARGHFASSETDPSSSCRSARFAVAVVLNMELERALVADRHELVADAVQRPTVESEVWQSPHRVR